MWSVVTDTMSWIWKILNSVWIHVFQKILDGYLQLMFKVTAPFPMRLLIWTYFQIKKKNHKIKFNISFQFCSNIPTKTYRIYISLETNKAQYHLGNTYLNSTLFKTEHQQNIQQEMLNVHLHLSKYINVTLLSGTKMY